MHIKNKMKNALFHFFGEKDNSIIHKLFNTRFVVLEEMEGRHLEYGRKEVQQGK